MATSKTERSPVDYVLVAFTTKEEKAADKAYQTAYKAMKEADAYRRAVKAKKMIREALIPEGTMPVFSVRKWDGVLQVLRDQASGEYLYTTPKSKASRNTDTI